MKLLRKFWAKLNGYFWLPCPLCDRMFGGFESATEGWRSKGKMVCWRCKDRVNEQNKKDFKEGKINYYWEIPKSGK